MSSWFVSLVLHLLVMVALAWRLVAVPGGLSLGIALDCQMGSPQFFDDAEDGLLAGGLPAVAQVATNVPAAGSPSTTEVFDQPPPVDPTGALPQAGPALGPAMAAGVGDDRGAAGVGGGKAGVGGQARTGVFGVMGEGRKFVYVFDRSGSMGGAGRNSLSAAKAQLLASLQNLGKGHQFQIIFYNERPSIFKLPGRTGGLVYATEQNKALAAKFVNSIVAEGGTKHEDALEMAITLRPDVIFFLTDADEPKLWPGQLAKIRRLAAGITINAIEFGLEPEAAADSFLVQLARQNGGQHAYVNLSKLFPVSAQ